MLLALDASTKSTGYAVYDDNKKLISKGCLTATYQDDLITRIYTMGKKILEVVKEYPIDLVVLEEVHPERGDEIKQLKTYKALMWLQAYINFLLYDYNRDIIIIYIYPSEWRKVCGIKSGKNRYRKELKEDDIIFAKTILNQNEEINDDVADAICIGYGYLNKESEEEFAW